MAAQRRNRGLAQGVVGHGADHRRLVTEPRQSGDDIGFRAADPYIELGHLEQALTPRRRHAEHDLAKGDQPAHARSLPSRQCVLSLQRGPSLQRGVVGSLVFRPVHASRSV